MLFCKTTTFGSIVILPPLPVAIWDRGADGAIRETDTIDGLNIDISTAGLLGFCRDLAVTHFEALSRIDGDIARTGAKTWTGAKNLDRGLYQYC